MVYKHDPSYVDVHVREIVLENANTVQNPAADDTMKSKSGITGRNTDPMSPGVLFLSQDRADITRTEQQFKNWCTASRRWKSIGTASAFSFQVSVGSQTNHKE